MTVNWERINCPLCGCIFGKIILKHDYGVLKKCRNCLTSYLTVRPNKEAYLQVGKTYLPSTTTNETAYKARVKEAEEDFERIEKYVKKGTVFDVGASSGIFLNVARHRNWNVGGNEISKYCIIFAKKIFGIKLSYGFLEDIEFYNLKVELVTMIQVIEHLLNPIEDIKKIKEILKNSGYLYITTPTFAEDVEFLKEHHMIPHHTVNFTKKALLKFLTDSGFDIVFSERYVVDKLPYIRVLCKKRKEQ